MAGGHDDAGENRAGGHEAGGCRPVCGKVGDHVTVDGRAGGREAWSGKGGG